MAGNPWNGWEPLGWLGAPGWLAGAAIAAADPSSFCTLQSGITASLPVAKPSSAIQALDSRKVNFQLSPCALPSLRSRGVPPGAEVSSQARAMSERRGTAKGRRLGSSRRKQLRESSGDAPAPAPSPNEEPPWAAEIVQRVQQLLSDRDTEQAGVVTRSDMQVRMRLCPGVRHCWGHWGWCHGWVFTLICFGLEIARGRFAVQQGGAGAGVRWAGRRWQRALGHRGIHIWAP